MSLTTQQSARAKTLTEVANQKILIMDGAMGTMLQRYKLSEADYRGKRFANWSCDVQGNNDLLSLTQPEIIKTVHQTFLEAGADIIETNSFSATQTAQADYQMEELAYEINVESARLAREVADAMSEKTPEKPRFVAGSIGPTNRTASISPDVNDPSLRNITFKQLTSVYYEAAKGLIEGGSDILLVETIFDTLNAKAALFAIDELFEAEGYTLPVMISGTITDLSGRTLSGQTPEAFWNSLCHARPFSIGFNCALGPAKMRPFLTELEEVADSRISVYPNAGLPNEMGEYDETPEQFSSHIKSWAEEGLLNIVGGCCGTTPQHIQAAAKAVKGIQPRQQPTPKSPTMRLSGLEPLSLTH